jgi:hypothetical protein
MVYRITSHWSKWSINLHHSTFRLCCPVSLNHQPVCFSYRWVSFTYCPGHALLIALYCPDMLQSLSYHPVSLFIVVYSPVIASCVSVIALYPPVSLLPYISPEYFSSVLKLETVILLVQGSSNLIFYNWNNFKTLNHMNLSHTHIVSASCNKTFLYR